MDSTLYAILAALSVYYLGLYLYKRSAPSLRNVTGPPPMNFLLGNVPQLMLTEGYEFHTHLARNYGSVVKLHAICGAKQLYVFDHAALHSILVKDEPIWRMPEVFLAANHLIFGPCLVSTSGQRHRRARKIMNPLFSPARMREIVPVLYKIAHSISDTISKRLESQREIDMLAILGNTSLEFVGQAGLGHTFAAAGSEQLKGMKQLLFLAKRMIIPMQLLPLVLRIGSSTLRRRLLKFVPLPDLHKATVLVDAMSNSTQNILNGKKEAMERGDEAVLEQIGHGKDLMSLLMRANESVKQDEKLPEEELLGQMNVVLFAGVDTTSSTMSRALQELAMHPDLQRKLRDEVTEAAAHGDIDYETLSALPILDAVVRETLRMYPAAVTASRQNSKDVIMPLSTPMIGVDGQPITELFVPAGTIVHVAIKAANQDPAIWGPDSAEWKPERWLSELPKSVVDAQIPGIHPKLLTFIAGPRACLGYKFAEVSMRLNLALLVKKFDFSLSDKNIIWKVGVAEAPTVEGKHVLPLIVTPIQVV